MRTAIISCALALGGCADEYCEEYGACDGEILSTADWERIEGLSAPIPGDDEPLLGTPPEDPDSDEHNPYADDEAAAALGKKIFEDRNLSADGIGCVTCHAPERWFTTDLPHRPPDGKPFRGITSVIDVAYYPQHKWDGAKESLLDLLAGAIELPHLTGASRVEVALHVYNQAEYAPEFAAVWPEPELLDELLIASGRPDDPESDWGMLELDEQAAVNEAFACVKWALEAYLRTVVSEPSTFDLFVHEGGELEEDAQRGLAVFLRKGCDNCHSGPRLTDDAFHNIGLAIAPEDTSFEDSGRFRTPTLRNVAMTPPYMHTRQYGSLEEVLWYYDAAEHAAFGELDPKLAWPLEITDAEADDLVAFLETLTSTSCPWGPDGQCPPAP